MTEREGKGKGNMSIGPRMKYEPARDIFLIMNVIKYKEHNDYWIGK